MIDDDRLESCHSYPPNRRAFYIKNPFLPKATPLKRKELSISIEEPELPKPAHKHLTLLQFCQAAYGLLGNKYAIVPPIAIRNTQESYGRSTLEICLCNPC
ncbi:MAG TPA: hypothetical protein PK002_11555, partial [Cellvibrio sp.]|nr:hypothetical protein [Cellvibrio sp.]